MIALWGINKELVCSRSAFASNMIRDWMHHGHKEVMRQIGGLMKHDESRFCGIYLHVSRLNKSRTNVLDTLKRAYDLYRENNAKKSDYGI